MAYAIPKIQWKNIDTTGDTTSANGDVLNIPSTTLIEIGMFIRGAGIPTGATVGSKTASSVTLAGGVLATATATAAALSFGYEISFDFPPKEATGESQETFSTVSQSLSGIRQVAVNFTEGVRDLIFSHISPALYALMSPFLSNAVLGNPFRYFEDKTSSNYLIYELKDLKIHPVKIAPKGIDLYVWEIPLKFRRVL